MNKELVVLTVAFALAAGIVFAQEMKMDKIAADAPAKGALAAPNVNAEGMNAEATNTENMNEEATNAESMDTEATNAENMNAQVPAPAEEAPGVAPAAAQPKY